MTRSQISVLALTDLLEAQNVIEQITQSASNEWYISNKYYQATVSVKIYSDSQALLKEAQGSPAVLVVCAELGPLITRNVLSEIEWDDLDVKLLVRTGSCLLPSHEAEDWGTEALNQGFEFVDACAETTDDGPEGIARVREALEAHLWPTSTPTTNGKDKFEDDFHPFQCAPVDNVDTEGCFDTDDPLRGFDNFASVLSQVQAMRQHAMSLDDLEARRDFAEQASSRIASILAHDENL